ncbi:MAG: glycosyltransferase family 2 protein [Leptolyngbya sp. DLM2.Bin15]|nr:MAG: glycosyltransferase family 2 protein [Leptolyngbya sp. DLM2.Bin15]
MSPSPTVSVVLPVYNAERYVAQSIESVLSQTFTDFELLIGDDCSSDRSLDIINHYAAQDARIQVIQNPENYGGGKTRNCLIAQAKGTYVAAMDADDISLPDRLALQVQFLEDHPEVVCLGGAHDLIDGDGRLLTRLHLPEQDEEIQSLALAGHGSICHPCAMIRRSVLKDLGGYDEAMISAQDLDLWLRLGERGQLANLPDAILKYRLHANSVSQNRSLEQRQNARIACERAWQRRGIEGRFEAGYAWRPTTDPESQHHFMLKYGWWAFNSRQRQTALVYGWRAIKLRPFQTDSWMLLGCAIAKPMPSLKEP